MSKAIQISPSPSADSRTCDHDVTKQELEDATFQHMDDVTQAINFIQVLIDLAAANHDYTKIAYIDEFYRDFSDKACGNGKFKYDGSWFTTYHLQERHHLNDKVPDDVNLIDVIEMLCDCVMAGMARSGDVYDIEIDADTLQKAVKNTVELLKANTEIVEGKQDE